MKSEIIAPLRAPQLKLQAPASRVVGWEPEDELLRTLDTNSTRKLRGDMQTLPSVYLPCNAEFPCSVTSVTYIASKFHGRPECWFRILPRIAAAPPLLPTLRVQRRERDTSVGTPICRRRTLQPLATRKRTSAQSKRVASRRLHCNSRNSCLGLTPGDDRRGKAGNSGRMRRWCGCGCSG